MSENPQLSALLLRIEDLIIENKIKEAINILEEKISEFEDCTEIFNTLGELHLMESNPNIALRYLNRALELTPENLDTLELLGDAYYVSEEYNQAKISWIKVIEIDLRRYKIWQKLGVLYYETGEYVNANQALSKYLEFEENAEIYSLLATIFQKMGNEIECWNNLMRAEEIDPTNDRILVQIGQTYFELDNFDRAIEYFNKASEANPSNLSAWFQLGKSFEEKQNFTQALESFYKVIEIDPDNVLGYYSLAKIYAADANIVDAIRYFKECLNHDPSFEDASLSLASLYWASKEYESALALLKEALRYNESGQLFRLIGDIYEELGEKEKAQSNWEKATKLEEG